MNKQHTISNAEMEDLEVLLRFMAEHWVDAWVQGHRGEHGRPLRAAFLELLDPGPHEFFIWRNEEARSSDTMEVGHVIVEDDSFNFVYGDAGLGDKLEKHIEDQRIERRVMERLRSKLQREHDRRVYEAVSTHIQGWQNGTLHTNDTERMAKLAGVELQQPVFLDRLLETLHSVVLEDES